MKKIENMEMFKNNLESQGFSNDFIKKAIEYFIELEEEMEVQEMESIEEVIDYYAKIMSFTCNTSKSENNLKDLRKDLFLLYEKDSYGFIDFKLYFENIEMFEIYVLYVLFFEFYPQEEDEEK